MPSGRFILVCAGIGLGVAAAAGGFYYTKKTAAGGSSPSDPRMSAPGNSGAAVSVPTTNSSNTTGDIAQTTTDFLGKLTPGGTSESAGKERNYIVTYQVAFLRKAPEEKVPEESMSYQQLMQQDSYKFPPFVFYGEVVRGKFDPAHPGSIAVTATINKKEEQGYIDARKLWLEPEIGPAENPRYMALKDATAIHVVPEATSPTVLAILQGEVVEAVGKVSFQGGQWIKARCNANERPRYGFIEASEVLPLTVAAVNPSIVGVEEVPRKIRESDISLVDADRQKLSKTGFYVESVSGLTEVYVDDMAESYADWSHGRQFFVTSDLFLHVHHLIFDRMLQDVEEKKISPTIRELSKKLAKTTESELNGLPATVPAAVREALTHDLIYFSVAAKLFDPGFEIPEPARRDAGDFIGKIEAAAGELPSLSQDKVGAEDFTQYKPRGHYEKNETLQRYFRGMMWFGRRNFLLSDKNMTLAAVLIPGLAEKAGAAQALDALDRALAYLVGPQDKYTLAGYRSINKEVFGMETPGPGDLGTNLDERLRTFADAVESTLPAPQIVSVQTGIGKPPEERLKEVRGFKLLGQRYTLDAYFFNQLTSPSVGTVDNPRNLPSSLDVMMLLGSAAAREQQDQTQQQHHWANYESQTQKLQGFAEEHFSRESSFYESWLKMVNSLFIPSSSRQLFATGKPWQYKNLNAGAASWTELKHDTILYAEQSSAEMGEGDEFAIAPYNPPAPKGYIEPNPVFFERQAQSIEHMLERLKRSGMITDEYLDKFTTLEELSRKAGVIAQKEISGTAIDTEGYAWIESLSRYFGPELLLPRGMDTSMIKDRSELQMALIADIATDAVEGRVLEAGTGKPQRIVVVVKDAYGGTRLTVGYVYSWYEFASQRRWADSEWKKIVYSDDLAEKKQNGIESPSWYSMFYKN